MTQADRLEKACSLVGRFQYHFGRLEQKIDQALIKLLDLNELRPHSSLDYLTPNEFVAQLANAASRHASPPGTVG
jgi:transposase InsO family protein